jgi:hypothetical protein
LAFIKVPKQPKGRPKKGSGPPLHPTLDQLAQFISEGVSVYVDIVLIESEWYAFACIPSKGYETMTLILLTKKKGFLEHSQLWGAISKVRESVPTANIRIVADRAVWGMQSVDRRRNAIIEAVERAAPSAIGIIADLLQIQNNENVRMDIINVLNYFANSIDEEGLLLIAGAINLPTSVLKCCRALCSAAH